MPPPSVQKTWAKRLAWGALAAAVAWVAWTALHKGDTRAQHTQPFAGVAALRAPLVPLVPEPVGPLATLDHFSGSTVIRRAAQNKNVAAATQGAPLFEDDLVSTGNDGEADLTFAGKNQVHLGPNSSIVIKNGAHTATSLGAVVLSGSARATAGGKGIGLSIGTPLGLAQLPAAHISVMDVSFERGLQVLTGEVKLEGLQSLPKTVAAGEQISIAGLIMPASTGAVAGLSFVGQKPEAKPIPSLKIRLEKNMSHVMIKSLNAKRYKAARRKQRLLLPGDHIKVSPMGKASVSLDPHMTLRLLGDNEMTLTGSQSADDRHIAQLVLEGGEAEVLLQKGPVVEQSAINVAGTIVSIEPTGHKAEVLIQQPRLGLGNTGQPANQRRARITVRAGEATLADGTHIEAGQAVEVQEGRVVRAPASAFAAPIAISPNKDAIVFYEDDVPPIGFAVGSASAQNAQQIALAKTQDFNMPVAVERLHHSSYVTDQMRKGRVFWKSGATGQKPRVLDIVHESVQACKDCARKEAIDDNGQSAVIVFEQALPEVSLQWGKLSGAKNYNLKVFRHNDFATPFIDELLTATRRTFAPGTFNEGSYTWLVVARSEDNTTLSTGRTNSLSLRFDNAVKGLNIRAPQHGLSTHADKIVTQGEVEPGLSLKIDGKQVALDPQNRFATTIGLLQGFNRIVYHLSGTGGPDRFYTRDVHRQP